MAERPIFIPKKGYVDQCEIKFQWYPGFAISQKKKNVISLHQSAKENHGIDGILEISTKGLKASKFIDFPKTGFNSKLGSLEIQAR